MASTSGVSSSTSHVSNSISLSNPARRLYLCALVITTIPRSTFESATNRIVDPPSLPPPLLATVGVFSASRALGCTNASSVVCDDRRSPFPPSPRRRRSKSSRSTTRSRQWVPHRETNPSRAPPSSSSYSIRSILEMYFSVPSSFETTTTTSGAARAEDNEFGPRDCLKLTMGDWRRRSRRRRRRALKSRLMNARAFDGAFTN